MPEGEPAEGAVTRDQIAALAALFDRFEFAFDPRSTAAKEAESDFDNLVRRLFDECVQANYPEVSFVVFHCKVKSQCRAFLRKNAP